VPRAERERGFVPGEDLAQTLAFSLGREHRGVRFACSSSVPDASEIPGFARDM